MLFLPWSLVKHDRCKGNGLPFTLVNETPILFTPFCFCSSYWHRLQGKWVHIRIDVCCTYVSFSFSSSFFFCFCINELESCNILIWVLVHLHQFLQGLTKVISITYSSNIICAFLWFVSLMWLLFLMNTFSWVVYGKASSQDWTKKLKKKNSLSPLVGVVNSFTGGKCPQYGHIPYVSEQFLVQIAPSLNCPRSLPHILIAH